MDLDTWVRTRTFHHSRYADKARLVALKEKKGLRISLGFPTYNEESTIGKMIIAVRGELQIRYPLLDEIAIVDSGSSDYTCEVAAVCGADVLVAKEHLPHLSVARGKGENLWKSLYLLSGDIIVWIDADIHNIHPKFVYGLIGPLLEDDTIGYVKAFYRRPLRARGRVEETGGGRVTELLIRPFFSMFFPELAGFAQPLSGEYAGRRSVLEQVPFRVGYGVETGLLIDIYQRFGLDCFAQVDLDRRLHRNQPLEALSRMSFVILHTLFSRLRAHQRLFLDEDPPATYRRIRVREDLYEMHGRHFDIIERPPMIEIPEYREKHRRQPPVLLEGEPVLPGLDDGMPTAQ